MRDYKKWLSTFRESIATYNYYVDYKKIHLNVDKIECELALLSTLIGKKNIENEFLNLIEKYPKLLNCIPILIAVRLKEINVIDNGKDLKFNFVNPNYNNEMYLEFVKKVGLLELMQNRLVYSLKDYVIGIETGLDSNARKNRGGHLMEDIVEYYIKKAGYIKDETYYKEMYISEIKEKFSIDLSSISNNNKTEKRFDYVLIKGEMVYAIETNFYQSGGSKLNETARSYKLIANESKKIKKFKFIWITDGLGWLNAKNNLRETFEILECLYNINDLQNGILEQL